MQNSISAIIVAGGQGTRLGSSVPKAFVELGGKPMFAWSLEVVAAHEAVAETVLVVPADLTNLARVSAKQYAAGKKVTVVHGGKERWESVISGVNGCGRTEWILIHDAARPFVNREVVDAVLDKADKYRAVISATHVHDTIRHFDGDRASGTVDRSTLVRVGTPQLFKKTDLLAGFKELKKLATAPTDEAMLMEAMGIEVGIAWGDPKNFKITTPADLEIAEALVRLPR